MLILEARSRESQKGKKRNPPLRTERSGLKPAPPEAHRVTRGAISSRQGASAPREGKLRKTRGAQPLPGPAPRAWLRRPGAQARRAAQLLAAAAAWPAWTPQPEPQESSPGSHRLPLSLRLHLIFVLSTPIQRRKPEEDSKPSPTPLVAVTHPVSPTALSYCRQPAPFLLPAATGPGRGVQQETRCPEERQFPYLQGPAPHHTSFPSHGAPSASAAQQPPSPQGTSPHNGAASPGDTGPQLHLP